MNTKLYRIAGLTAVALLGILCDPSRAADKPNIVFILADDLGYGDLGSYNKDSKIPTPHLDQFAGEGMRFTDAHAPSSVCSPTRYALLTGRYAWRSRLQRGVLGPWDKPLIAPERLTVAALLKEHGYTTACIGKWHLGLNWPTTDGKPPSSRTDPMSNVDFTKPIAGGPTARGFDHYFGTLVPNYPPFCFVNDDRTVGIPSVPAKGGLFNVPGPMLPDWKLVDILPGLTRHAVGWVETTAKSGQPFFLYLPLTSPHYPVVPAPEFRGKSGAGEYGDFVVQTDWTVGQVLDALKRSGVADNTLVIFTSDNGPEVASEVTPGAYDRVRQFQHSSMGALRGVKRDAWEGGHRVPFIARWPGKIKAGAVSDETMCHVDFMATVAAVLGAKLPDHAAEDSVNVLPVLLGDALTAPAREATVHHSISGKFAIRRGDWVLIVAPSGDDNRADGEPQWLKDERGYTNHDQPGELFNVREDPAERYNHFAEKPEIVRELKALLERYKREGRSTPGTPQKNDVELAATAPKSPDTDAMSDLISNAGKGDDGAQFALAVRYRDGKGVEQDIPKALELRKKAAAMGHGRAASTAAMTYLAGEGVPSDAAQARKLAERAVELNDPSGFVVLGEMHFQAGGHDRARAHWTKVAQMNPTGATGNPEQPSGEMAAQQGADLLKLMDHRQRPAEPGKCVLLPMPHVHQGWNNCGSTSCAMFARAQGQKLGGWDFSLPPLQPHHRPARPATYHRLRPEALLALRPLRTAVE